MEPRRRAWEIDTVLFDFDGTLVDSSRAICRAFNEALATEARPAVPDEAIRPMIGRPLVEMFATVDAQADREALERYVGAYRAAWDLIAVPLTSPLPAMMETIDGLGRHRKLGVVTSRLSSGAHRIIDALGLSGRFDVVVGLEHVARPKPDPEAVHLALGRLGARAERAMMVGDTPDDVLAGRAAGAVAVGVTTGVYDRRALLEAGADAVVDGLAGVLGLVEPLS